MTQHACDCASPQQDACFLEQRREDHVLIATRRKSGKWDRIRITSLRSCLDCHKTEAWTSVRLEGQAKARVCTAKEKQERQGRDGGQGCCSSCSFVQGRHGRGEHAQPLSALHAARLRQNASKSWPRKCGMPSGRLVRGWTDGSICRPADVVAGT